MALSPFSLPASVPDSPNTTHDCTTPLIKLCQQSNWRPDPILVSTLVSSGANICCLTCKDEDGHRSSSFISKPVLTWLIEEDNVECVSACLSSSPSDSFSSPRVIDFTVIDTLGRNPLHALVEVCAPDEDIVSMLSAVVYRLETHPHDVVDWGQRTVLGGALRQINPTLGLEGQTVLSLAAENQKLHVVWPLVRDLPYFSDQIDPIYLPRVWTWEWDALGEDQQFFSKVGVEFIHANRSTGKLFQHCVTTNWKPDPNCILRYVKEGANISFADVHMRMPILHRLLFCGDVDCVRACLATSDPIDFTLGDVDGFTPFHAMCSLTQHPETVAALINAILDRIQRTLPILFSASSPFNPPTESTVADIVDWRREDNFGNNFFSLAAYHGNLSVVWKVMKDRGVLLCDEALSVEISGSIPLTMKISESDWGLVSESDKRHFSLKNGLICVLDTGVLV